jgi:hypothetical protein
MTPEPAAPGDGYWRLIEPAWNAVSIYEGEAVFREGFARLRPEVGHLLAGHWCQSEVRAGGLYHFFMHPAGVLAPEAAAGFAAIGIPEWADVLTDAMAHFGPDYPRTRSLRLPQLMEMPRRGAGEDWNPFADLDEQFFAWLQEDGDRWRRLADEYAARVGG